MASGGFLVAFATKHADAVAKTVATSVALVLVVVLEIIIFGSAADLIVILASSSVLLGMDAYREAGQDSRLTHLPLPAGPGCKDALDSSGVPIPIGAQTEGDAGVVESNAEDHKHSEETKLTPSQQII